MGNKKKRDAKAIIASARRPETSIDVCMRGDLAAEHEQLDAELQRAQADDGWVATSVADVHPAIGLAARIAAIETQMADSIVSFRFRALPRKEWDAFLDAHPARPQTDERFNMDTLPVAIVSACLVDPEMTIEEVDELFDVLSEGGRSALFQAAWSVNQEVAAIPFSRRASAVNRWRDASSKQPEPGESLEASSLDAQSLLGSLSS